MQDNLEEEIEISTSFCELEAKEASLEKPVQKGVRIGSLAGKGYNIPDDFNEPLDDLKEYMF